MEEKIREKSRGTMTSAAHDRMTKQMTRMIRIEAIRSGEANLSWSKVYSDSIQFKNRKAGRLLATGFCSGSPNDTKYQGDDRQYDQYVDQATYAVNKYAQ